MKKIRLFPNYSKREIIGLNALLGIIILLIILRFLILCLPETKVQNSLIQKLWSEYCDSLKQDSIDKANWYFTLENHIDSSTLYMFNPQKVDSFELRKLGFGLITISEWQKLKTSGWKFYSLNSMKKLKTLDNTEMNLLKNYLVFDIMVGVSDMKNCQVPNKLTENKIFQRKDTSNTNKLTVNISTANEDSLIMLPGIGVVYAGRIVSYRNLLGGFFKVSQLKEVYGISDSTFQNCLKFITCDENAVTKLPLKGASVKALMRHPYIGFKHAKMLTDAFKKDPSLNERSFLNIVNNDSSFVRILPYIRFN